MAKIFIDAGHGGNDSGAVGNGLKEKDVNLKIAERVKAALEQNYIGADVLMSRETDKTMSLKERTDKANDWGADIYVSIHINAASSSAANGFESFIFDGSIDEHTKRLQDNLHAAIMENTQNEFSDRKQKRANFHVLRESYMEACLTENGFISNKNDAEKLKSDLFLYQIAHGHAVGIARFFGLNERTKEEKQEADSGYLYKVQIGAFTNRDNAERLAEQAEKDNYNVYIVRERK